MIYFIKFIYGFIFPPGIFIIIFFVLGLWLYCSNKIASWIFQLSAVIFYLFSTSLISGLLIHSYEYRFTPSIPLDCDAVVVLGGGAKGRTYDVDGIGTISGQTASRLLIAAKLQKKYNLPIILSGGQVYADSGNEAQIMKRDLISLGINSDKILIEDKSRTTKENAELTKLLLNQNHFKKPILVTSALHMGRALHHFKKVGVTDIIPYPCDYLTSPVYSVNINSFIPSYLSNTTSLIKEIVGTLQ